MPLYDYKCSEHGIFSELATVDESSNPCKCPVCGSLSPRIIKIPLDILNMPKETKKAHETNERSSHEPMFSIAEQRREDSQHAKACGCGQKVGKSKLFFTAKGEKMFPSMRPWMISH